jgi:hypothetical protein
MDGALGRVSRCWEYDSDAKRRTIPAIRRNVFISYPFDKKDVREATVIFLKPPGLTAHGYLVET